ncbi:MAG TPA: hypothetical protein VGN23_09500 [Verrucomicrobiae bacterium]
MKTRLNSWILAGAYFVFGLMVFFVMPHFLSQFSEEGAQQFPTFSTIVFTVSPAGWLLVMLAIGTIVILKDFRFRSRLLNPIFTTVLLLLASGIIFAVAVVWFDIRFNTMSA